MLDSRCQVETGVDIGTCLWRGQVSMSTELKYDVEAGNKYKSVQARLKSLKENNIGDKVIMDMY